MIGTKLINSIFDISEKYDNFIIDQWGVLHDGQSPYPGVKQTLQKLVNQNKTIILLSNSSKTKSFNAKLLESIGFDTTLFKDIISSGEAFYRYRKNQPFDFLTQPAFYISSPNYKEDKAGIEDITITRDLSKAGWILLAGIDPTSSFDKYETIFSKAVKQRLPLVCTNPDVLIVKPDKTTFKGPGFLAKQYKKMGGKTLFFGKPYDYVYQLCQEAIGDKNSNTKTLAVGDSLEHDIKGASDSGYDSLFIGGGIFYQTFAKAKKDILKTLQIKASSFGVLPTYYMLILN